MTIYYRLLRPWAFHIWICFRNKPILETHQLLSSVNNVDHSKFYFRVYIHITGVCTTPLNGSSKNKPLLSVRIYSNVNKGNKILKLITTQFFRSVTSVKTWTYTNSFVAALCQSSYIYKNCQNYWLFISLKTTGNAAWWNQSASGLTFV